MSRGLLGAGVAVALAASLASAWALVAEPARASVSIEVTWDGLLRESTAAVMATSVETRAVWENGRIYTYARLHVDRAIAGALPTGGEAWVRTMGGIVGKIGQSVDGEAVLSPGESGLLFLHPGPPGAYVVTARGQGQFPLVQGDDPKAPPHLVRSHAAGTLLPPRPAATSAFAADVVHGRAVDDVARDVVAAWDQTHVPVPSPAASTTHAP
jgi:hypothetical protein